MGSSTRQLRCCFVRLALHRDVLGPEFIPLWFRRETLEFRGVNECMHNQRMRNARQTETHY